MINYYSEIELKISSSAYKIETTIIDKLNSDNEIVLATLFKRIMNGYNSINLFIIGTYNHNYYKPEYLKFHTLIIKRKPLLMGLFYFLEFLLYD